MEKCRMDFSIEVVHSDEEERTIQVRVKPNPRRYSKVMHDNKEYYLDKYLKTMISLEEMAENMKGLPIFHHPPSVEDLSKYAEDRKVALKHELETGEYTQPLEPAKAHQEFHEQKEGRDISFLSVDIHKATAYKKNLPSDFEKAYEIFIRELGSTVGQFHGSILKTTGDGFIAYIDIPSFTAQCDLTIDLGLSLINILNSTVNPFLSEQSIPPIEIRVGADYGFATSRTITIPYTGYATKEVSSDALNRAVKIEESCMPNQFRIGESLYKLIHTQWLERAREVDFDSSSVGISNYKVYEVR